MLALISIALLLLAALAMVLLRLFRPNFVYHWLVAVGGALIAWPLLLMARMNLPQQIPLVTWRPETLFPGSPAFLIDHLSWPYAIAVGVLVVAVILTDVARASEVGERLRRVPIYWSAWAGSLLLAALGLIAILAGNPITLVMAWMAIDFTELLVLLGQVKTSLVRERVVIVFSARVLGTVLLLAAGMVASMEGETLTFAAIPPQASVFMVLAAGLRLGVLPLHLPFLQVETGHTTSLQSRQTPLTNAGQGLRRGLGTMIRLVPAAASLILLARTATAGAPPALDTLLLVLSGLAALYGGASWALATDELDGRPAWILGMASFSVAAAVRTQPSASLAWGMATLLSGGLLFLTSNRDRRLSWLLLLGLLGFSALPYSPSWNGARLFNSPFSPILVLFLLALVLLMAGYIRHALRPGLSLSGVERWVWLIYPLGLVLLPATHAFFGLWTLLGLRDSQVAAWWVGPIALGLVGLLVYWNPEEARLPRQVITGIDSVLSLRWMYRLLWTFYHSFGRIIAFITRVLEGEGGVLWALLLLVLLLLVLARSGAGG